MLKSPKLRKTKIGMSYFLFMCCVLRCENLRGGYFCRASRKTSRTLVSPLGCTWPDVVKKR